MDAIWSDLLRQRYIQLLPLVTRDAITRSSFCRSDFRRDRNRRFYLWAEECLVAANGRRARADRVPVFCLTDLAALCDRPVSVWRTVHLARLGNASSDCCSGRIKATDPVIRLPVMVGHCNDVNVIGLDRIEELVGKATQCHSTYLAALAGTRTPDELRVRRPPALERSEDVLGRNAAHFAGAVRRQTSFGFF
jgi:hypothetical protein